jgi:hypothetical protein
VFRRSGGESARASGPDEVIELSSLGVKLPTTSPMTNFTLSPGYPRLKVVHSFAELVATPFSEGVNALCWPRTLSGNFLEIVEQLEVREGITSLNEAMLEALSLSEAGQTARAILLEDQRRLRALGLAPELNCIGGYPRDEEPGPVPVDVYSFHVDSAPVPAETWLCTYHGAASEGLRNEEALRRVEIPETRAQLLRVFGGEDSDAFGEYLTDNCFDLHFTAIPQARPFSFGVGNLWRIACQYPNSPVPPCIHRAPESVGREGVRLLLIS